MIGRIAIVLAVLGLGIAGWFAWRGPSVSTPSTALRWTRAPLDAGELEVQFSTSGVDFIRARDASVPQLTFAVLRRGEDTLVLDDFNFFHLVEPHEGRLWVIGESTTEGPGPSIELLVSADEGRTFEHRASVPKPNYQAMLETWSVEGEALTLVLSLDDTTPLADPWLGPWWALPWPELVSRPTVGPGRVLLRSKNGGRRWRLER